MLLTAAGHISTVGTLAKPMLTTAKAQIQLLRTKRSKELKIVQVLNKRVVITRNTGISRMISYPGLENIQGRLEEAVS